MGVFTLAILPPVLVKMNIRVEKNQRKSLQDGTPTIIFHLLGAYYLGDIFKKKDKGEEDWVSSRLFTLNWLG